MKNIFQTVSMTSRKNLASIPLIMTATLLILPGSTVNAQHSHDEGHSHSEVTAAKNFTAALREIGERMNTLNALLEKGELDAAHEQADAIGALSKSLGALSLKPDSGVAKDQIKVINKSGKALAIDTDALHEAGEIDDLAAAKSAFAKMKVSYEVLSLFKPMNDKFGIDVKPVGGKIEAGKPANLLFTLKDPTGLPVKSVEVVHEKSLQLLMVSKDLSWFAHEHPVLQPDGTFTFTYTFPAGGEYTLFNNFTPKDAGMQVVPVTLAVEGAATTMVPLKVDSDKPKTVDGYSVSLDTAGPIKTGTSTHMAYTITKDGKPVNNLQPYFGAMGHLVIISQDMKELVHSHQHEGSEHGDAAAKSSGNRVDFEADFKTPGVYKGWAQFNVGTKESTEILTVPFTLTVVKGNDASHSNDHAKAQHVEVVDNHNEEMPAALGADEESKLYLVPGGIYTQADIDANGATTASGKYKGKMAKHDASPKSGDLICPFSMTKANAKFTWIIGGKSYSFCCPPCIDEFVLMAKTNPSAIKDPEQYRKQ